MHRTTALRATPSTLALGSRRDESAAIRRSVAGSVVGKVAELAGLLALATVVPRVLGPDAYGRFALPLTLVTVGSLAMTLGGPVVLARFVPAAPEGERVALARALGWRLAKGRAVQLVAVTAGAVVAVGGGLVPLPATVAVVVALALNVAATLALQVALGLGRTGPWTSRWPVQNAVLILVVLALHDAHGSAAGSTAIVVSAAVAAVQGAIVVWPVVRAEAQPVGIPDGAVRFGVLQAAGAAATQLSHRGPVVAMALLGATSAETAHVALATGIGLGVTYAVIQAFTVTLPHLAAAEGGHGEEVSARLASGILAVLAAGALAGAVLLDDLVPVVVGDGYRDAVDVLRPTLAVVVLAPLTALLTQVAALRRRADVAAAAGAAAVTVFVVAAPLAIDRWGGVGATSAALAATAASLLTGARLLPGAIPGRLAAAAAVVVPAVVLVR